MVQINMNTATITLALADLIRLVKMAKGLTTYYQDIFENSDRRLLSDISKIPIDNLVRSAPES